MNDNVEIRRQLQQAVAAFEAKPLLEAAENFWNILGYKSERKYEQSSYDYEDFARSFSSNHNIREDRALKDDWNQIHILFQLTDQEISNALSAQSQLFIEGLNFESVQESNLKSYLMMAIELTGDGYSRTKLANLTREINRCFLSPVLLLIKTASKLHLSVIFRRRHKRDAAKDVLEKVTIIKDIDIKNPHRAHIDILSMLSLESLHQAHQFHNFDGLHKAWQATLDISELNKRFYKELSNWFYWALGQVNFPDEEKENIEERNSIGLIRLLTRLIFVWFMKEKSLVPDALFDLQTIPEIIHFEDAQGSSYYKAILQNLFFATLNYDPTQEQEKGRRFRVKSAGYYNKDFSVFNVFRYEDLFRHPEDVIQRYFDDIPFLNGGIFECLDSDERTGSKTRKIYKDGFSDRKDNPIRVPDQLFLLDREIDCDLNDYFGTKNKSYKTKGLLAILHSYKFTIAENTPIEEEVALDPELLGRVFENLLAAYNPETKISARNQTGSFYTPREIVDFMVNEAIINHLLASFEGLDTAQREDMDIRLRLMMSYTEEDAMFSEDEVNHLISTIAKTKIIDPACGSGAFPMGLLLKMVYILHKLDPDNKKWKDRQIENITQEYQKRIDTAKDQQEKDDLQGRLREDISRVEHTFNEYELDYSRKLFLIERCIYGVDIQSIAIQISQLRFFISLLVDQVPDIDKENYGIQSLPNLENNFVAADSLIPIDLGEQTEIFGYAEIEKYFEDTKQLHSRYFNLHNRKEKNELREREKQLRRDFAESITKIGVELEVAQKIAAWDPYKRDESADFFHPQIMFQTDKFDIVIANPPYIRQKNIDNKELLEKSNYKVYDGTADLYTYFYELGLKLLKDMGTLSFITSNKWLRAGYGEKLRKLLAQDTTLRLLVDFRGYQVFEATVDTNVIILQKQKPANDHQLSYLNIPEGYKDENLDDYVQKNSRRFEQNKLSQASWILDDIPILNLKHKLDEVGRPLIECKITLNRGIITGYNPAFIINTSIKERLCTEDPKSIELIKPVLRGRNIGKYSIRWGNEWLIKIESGWTESQNQPDKDPYEVFYSSYPAVAAFLLSEGNKVLTGEVKSKGKGLFDRDDQGDYWWELRDCTYYGDFELPKIVYPVIKGASSFSYDDQGFYTNDKAFIITGEDLIPLLGILNSRVLDWYFRLINSSLGDKGQEFRKIYVKTVPIPSLNQYPALKAVLTEKVQSIINMNDEQRASDVYEMTLAEIDQIVYQLYELTPDEIALVEGN